MISSLLKFSVQIDIWDVLASSLVSAIAAILVFCTFDQNKPEKTRKIMDNDHQIIQPDLRILGKSMTSPHKKRVIKNALLRVNPKSCARQVKIVTNGILPKITVISYARIRAPLHLYNHYFEFDRSLPFPS